MSPFRRAPFLCAIGASLSLSLAACAPDVPTTGEPAKTETPSAKVDTPAKTETAPVRDIASHVGEYPSSGTKGAEPTTGPATPAATSFLANPKVTEAMFKLALPPSARGFLTAAATEVPVFKAGSMIVAHGCEPHNCGARNWSVAVSEDGAKAMVCTFEAKEGGTGSAVWYDGKAPVSKRAEGCPQSGAEYTAAMAG